ncbi:MAG: four-helix bundle copper-binding protein [Chloroflexales bacterium]|nr:four-helix bundle copper-binding protein [Chloroflexales bacterium]
MTMRQPMPTGMSGEMQQCINECLNCHSVCLSTVTYCLQQGGRHAEVRHIRTLLDCAQICATSADFMLRGSELHSRTCGVCAEVCARCADSCAQMSDDAMMQQCAEACRRCAESCRHMAAMA